MKIGQVVVAEWEDHTFEFGTWGGRTAPMKIQTAGFLVSLSLSTVVIALSKREDGQYAESQVIDRRMLLSLRKA